MCSRSTSRIFGTETSTETRRSLICRTMSFGLKLWMKTVVPPSIGGMNVAIDWPNMWLSGSRFRKRMGENGRAYMRYFDTSRSTGTMFASRLRWVITTPLGSAVAPDVKITSATSSRVTAASGTRDVSRQSSPASGHTSSPASAAPGSNRTSSPVRSSRPFTMPRTRRRKSTDAR